VTANRLRFLPPDRDGTIGDGSANAGGAMKLPAFLTEVDFGEILVTGSRIGLYHLLYFFNEGYTPEQLHVQFPTLSPSVIVQVLDFYRDNRSEVDAYLDQEQAGIDRQRAETPRKVDWDELRRRMAARRTGDAS
jgi:uncharacterized protein (DUF433 family)